TRRVEDLHACCTSVGVGWSLRCLRLTYWCHCHGGPRRAQQREPSAQNHGDSFYRFGDLYDESGQLSLREISRRNTAGKGTAWQLFSAALPPDDSVEQQAI